MSYEYEYEYASQGASGTVRGGAVGGFGAVSPELIYGPLTLQFALGLNAPVNHPARFPLLPLANPLPDGWLSSWDTGLYSIFAFTEFVAQAAWRPITVAGAGGVSAVHLQWQAAQANRVAFITGEITLLSQFMAQERERYMAEIVAQHDGAPGYWIALLNLEKGRKPWTLRLISFATRVGELVVMHAKKGFNRPRPSQVSPALMPPFGPPGHPSFPSGHSTQSWLTALCLKEVTRGPLVAQAAVSRYAAQIDWLAYRIAANRELGGFHYPSDTAAGQEMAGRCFAALLALADDAAVPARSLTEIVTEARAEWS